MVLIFAMQTCKELNFHLLFMFQTLQSCEEVFDEMCSDMSVLNNEVSSWVGGPEMSVFYLK